MIRGALPPLLLKTGLAGMVRGSAWRREHCAILCYHSLAATDENLWDNALYLTRQRLEERFALLRQEGYRILPLGEAVERLYARTLPPRSAVLTFDDGTRDFATDVVPLLEKYDYPATVYLSTWYCGQPRPVFRVFAKYVLWKGRAAYRGGPIWELGAGHDLATAEGRGRVADALRQTIRQRQISLEERDRILCEIGASLGVDAGALQQQTNFTLMTPAQVAEVSRHRLVSVELHTHRHRTPLDAALFRREIVENRERIAAMTGHTARHFCYPSGVHETDFLGWLRELEVRSATTGESGLAGPADEPLLLPRIVDTGNLSEERFRLWLSGAGHFLRRRGRVAARAQDLVT